MESGLVQGPPSLMQVNIGMIRWVLTVGAGEDGELALDG